MLGGNASRCYRRVVSARYLTPDSVHDIRLTVPVVVYPDDATQQHVHMSGLVYASQLVQNAVHQPVWCLPRFRPLVRDPERSRSSLEARRGPRGPPEPVPKVEGPSPCNHQASCFKLKHVAAPGQDPLARGWTRGGEIYLWVPKGVKAEGDIAWPPVATVRDSAEMAAVRQAQGPRGRFSFDSVQSHHLDTCAACMRKVQEARTGKARLSVAPLQEGWIRLYLLRHGQTDWNVEGKIQGRTDNPLNSTGQQQAAALNSFLAEVPAAARRHRHRHHPP